MSQSASRPGVWACAAPGPGRVGLAGQRRSARGWPWRCHRGREIGKRPKLKFGRKAGWLLAPGDRENGEFLSGPGTQRRLRPVLAAPLLAPALRLGGKSSTDCVWPRRTPLRRTGWDHVGHRWGGGRTPTAVGAGCPRPGQGRAGQGGGRSPPGTHPGAMAGRPGQGEVQ